MENQKSIDLFVPGRLCLLGEHSDWAGMQRIINANLVPGYAIVSGLQEGIYATARKADKFIVESSLPLYHGTRLECEMDTQKLLLLAQEGGFFSYVAGVASYINDNYRVGGVRIIITRMDLPIKSGLSSSAAICVLVARAFNQLYRLKMNTNGEMQAAFRGEQRTPSRCGRLDQACAYGVRPVLMEFDGFEIYSRPLHIGTTYYWVIADLKGKKDTVKILADLNKCYPFAETAMEETVQEALGCDNKEIINQAVKYMEQGNAQKLGELMTRAQENFDSKVAPACKEELQAPILHSVLQDEKIKPWIYGAKGVGSQGDGTVQFLCRNLESRNELMRYLEEERGMPSFSLTLKPGQTVRRAIIPIAGFGTRLFPATKGIKKDMLPILDKDGVLKPALLILLEQLEEAGIEEICLVIGEDEREAYDNFFAKLPVEHMEKLSKERRAYENKIVELGNKITFIYQRQRLGFGHAVYQCRDFTENEPVLLLLGDMIYESYEEKNCIRQVIEAFEQQGRSLVSIQAVAPEEVVHCGILYGQWDDAEQTVLQVERMYEKPTQDYAAECLGVYNARNEKEYYAVFGQYVLTPEVFEELEYNIREDKRSQGEYQLTDALDTVREKHGLTGFKPNGKAFDIGLPETYRQTMYEFGRCGNYI